MSGKGSKPRPYSVDGETFASNWALTFAKSNHDPAQVPVMPCDAPEESAQGDDSTSSGQTAL